MSTKEAEQKEEIKKTIVIDASPEVVFKAITDPNELTNWFPDQAILEPRVGGKMTIVTWELQKIENNKTRLNLIHSGFKAAKMPKAREEHDEGWTYFLSELAKYCKQRR
jgi:uncharacterized protein YndB with AHSA1/START domain